MTGLLREPLLHFFVLAAAIFGLFALLDDTPPLASEQTIIVTTEDASRLVAEFEATWRRPPDRDELDNLIEQLVRQEVYVREATALGLDQNDAIVRRRLQMKMEFLTEVGAQAVEPDDATLESHLAAHPERFSRPSLVAFEQLMLDDRAGDKTVREIKTSLNRGGDPVVVASPSLLPSAMSPSPRQTIDGIFGRGFFDMLTDLPEGDWAGPVTTPMGRHLVRVTERVEGGLPPLSRIRDQVLQDWRATVTANLREERFEAMRARYQITRPSAAEVLGQ